MDTKRYPANSLNHNLFEKWVSNSQSNIDIRENNLLFTMQEDMKISAKFLAAPSPFLTIKVSPENAGKVIGDGEKVPAGHILSLLLQIMVFVLINGLEAA